MGPLIILILLFFVMYTVMIRPQQRRAREHQALIAAVEVGDEVMTTAGIFGTVTSIEGDVIGIEIAPGTIMRVARAAIGRRILPDEPDEFDDDSSDDTAALEERSSSDIPTIIETPDDGDGPAPREQG
jgi:preprotein translocase subunit YajC